MMEKSKPMPNQSNQAKVPQRNVLSVFATTPCRAYLFLVRRGAGRSPLKSL
jgi:hypothetical protein